ncbi:ABC transporter ATP-binding protein [Xylanivirga thermophila]|jgi:putative ABC transport system ATP-binding protein|uniref:ABC transporter ATP-binding protein n=1 Tax=Xylanivirga thermophila TaxID=2496273 RepID=UPI00101CCD09|nr:ATP-binding cassette domain-containing protein [Xylanivirga thermophila]
MEEIFKLENVSVVRKNGAILKNISLEIHKGDFITIIGPSGSGKSTFLRILSTLNSPSSGRILYKGKDIMEYDKLDFRKKVRYVFQKPYLFGDTVMENIEFPFAINHQSIDIERVYKMMGALDLPKDFLDKKNYQLSGGEQQRIAFIRSLIIRPEVLLLDEVTASLDPVNVKRVEEFISIYARDEDITVLIVTHDIAQAERWGEETLYLKKGQIEHFLPTNQLFTEYKSEIEKFRQGEE